MLFLTLEVPDPLAHRLVERAAEQKKSVEQVALEMLAEEQLTESPEARYQRLLDQSGLFVKISEEEKRRYQSISKARRKELADKIGAAGPLSQLIIEERGPK